MEKKVVKVDYRGSFVKTLSILGLSFFILGIISIIPTIVGFINYLKGNSSEYYINMADYFLTYTIVLITSGAICRGISTMAKTALYKRALLEQEYEFM